MEKFVALLGILMATIAGILTGYQEIWEPLKWISSTMIFLSAVIVGACIDVARQKKR